MRTTELYGGLTLGAFVHGRLVGYSYALPGFNGQPFLLSCGLAVAAGFESRGIGLALKLEQARIALRMGYKLARWTTNALASGPLHLYLSKLGAHLVGYRPDMYARVLSTAFPDEVEIEWNLTNAGRPRARLRAEDLCPATRSRQDSSGFRRLVGLHQVELQTPGSPRYSVEIPWDRAALFRDAPDLAQPWIAGVRTAMQALLSAGYVGTAVLPDPTARRSFVVFARAEPDAGGER